jgi:hypothetical protein
MRMNQLGSSHFASSFALLGSALVVGLAAACTSTTGVLTSPGEMIADAGTDSGADSSPDANPTPPPCGSEPDFTCCVDPTADGIEVKPSCENGKLVCPQGPYTKAPIGTCTSSCFTVGGSCGPISDCDRGEGQLGSSKYSCGAGAPGTNVCCFKPPTPCGVEADFDCCLANDGVERPTCDSGVLVCPALSTKAPVGTCGGG